MWGDQESSNTPSAQICTLFVQTYYVLTYVCLYSGQPQYWPSANSLVPTYHNSKCHHAHHNVRKCKILRVELENVKLLVEPLKYLTAWPDHVSAMLSS